MMNVPIVSKMFNKLISNFPSAVAIGCGLSGGKIGSSCLLFCLGALGLLTQELIEDIKQGKDIETIQKHVKDALELFKQQHEGIELVSDIIAIENDIDVDHFGFGDSRSPYLIIHRFIQGEFDNLTEEVQSIIKTQIHLKEELNKSQKQQLQLLTVCREIAKTNPEIEQIEKLSEENIALQKQLLATVLSSFDDSDAFFELTLDELSQLKERFNTLLTQLQIQNVTQFPLDFRIYPNSTDDEKNNDQDIFRFHFRSRCTRLLGRDQELKDLLQFLKPDSSKPFDLKWWLWTGPGGLGKSRLALELCLEAHSLGYHAGFLHANSTGKISKEKFHQPHLIIIDYTVLQPDVASNLITELDTHQSSVSAPIRILILERSADSELDRWFQSFLSPENYSNKHKLQIFRYAEPRELKPLSNSVLWELMCSIFNERKKEFYCHQTEILEKLNLIDPQKRPLFAMMTADALKRDETGDIAAMRHWDQITLSDMILQKEVRRWKKSRLNDRLLNNVFFSTMTGAQSFENYDDINQSISEEEQLLIPGEELDPKDLQQIFCFSVTATEEKVLPYEPDILGEYFVLQRLLAGLRIDDKQTIKNMNEAYQLLKLAWCQFPLQTALFLNRTAKDFPDHPARDVITKLALEQCENVQQSLSSSFLLRGIAFVYFNSFSNSMADFTRIIDMLPAAPFDQVSLALLCRGFVHGHQGNSELAIEDYTRIIDTLPDAPIDEVAQALVSRGFFHGQQGNPDLAIEDYTRVIDTLLGAPTAQVALALVNRSIIHGQQGNPELAIEDLSRVIDTLPAAPADEVAKALVNRGHIHGQQGNPDLEIEDYTRVIDTLLGAPTAQVALALVNRSIIHGQQGNPELAIEDLSRVIDTLPAAPADEVAKALVNRGHIHGQQGNPDLEIEDYTRVIDTLLGAPTAQVALALVNRSIIHGQQGNPELAIEDLSRVIDTLPAAPADEVAKALINRSDIYCKQRRFDLAVNDSTRCIETLTDVSAEFIALSLFNRSEAYHQQQKLELALIDIKRVISINALNQEDQQNAQQFLAKLEREIND